MRKSKIVHGHEVVFQTTRHDVFFTVDGESFLEFDDLCGFGQSFLSRLGSSIFDLLVERLERFYSRGGLAYSDIPCSNIPSELLDFMDAGGSVDGFMRKFKALKRAGE